MSDVHLVALNLELERRGVAHRRPELVVDRFRNGHAHQWHLFGVDLVQRNDPRTANSVASEVPLPPSAILRRVRSGSWIARTIALLAPRLTQDRLRAIVLIQLSDHADFKGRTALERRLVASDEVQFCSEIAGPHDLVALLDCANMTESTMRRMTCWRHQRRRGATRRTSSSAR